MFILAKLLIFYFILLPWKVRYDSIANVHNMKYINIVRSVGGRKSSDFLLTKKFHSYSVQYYIMVSIILFSCFLSLSIYIWLDIKKCYIYATYLISFFALQNIMSYFVFMYNEYFHSFKACSDWFNTLTVYFRSEALLSSPLMISWQNQGQFYFPLGLWNWIVSLVYGIM